MTGRAVAIEAGPTARDLPLAGTRVLIVEDEPDAAELLGEILTFAGAVVDRAHCADDALRKMSVFRPELIVSDIGLPGVDGHELLRRIRALSLEEGGRTPAIALTAYSRGHDEERALAAGFQALLSKPFEPAQLIASLASLAGSHTAPDFGLAPSFG
jgi:CheY-like chemotaxis protein